MKKTISILLLTAALLGLSACSKQGTGSPPPVDASGYTQTSSNAPESASSAESSPETSAGESSSEASSAKPANTTPAGALAEGDRVADSYFDDAVFIGDSVSLKLTKYITAQRNAGKTDLGKAQFLTIGNMGSGNAQKSMEDETCVLPTYNGQKMYLEDSVAAMGAKKVYIMLGMNDVGLYGVEDSVANMTSLLAKIKEKSPEASIFVQSATPIVAGKEKGTWNNENFLLYNEKLLEMCKEKGYYYVDVSSVMRLEDGSLKPEFCSDPDNMGVHFSDVGCQSWIDYLYTHTAQS